MVTRFLHQDRGFGTEDLTGCILDGILTDVQSFNIADDGDEISASFVDTEDNEVTLAGTYVDGRLNGVLTVMSPGGRVVVVDLVLIGGFGADGMPMLDGTATVTADSDDLCVGAEADVWMMEGGAVAPDEPPPTGGPFQGPSMLVAQCRNDDTLVEVDPFNGSTRFITRLPIDILDVSQQLAELSHVSTMVFNEAEFTLWAGTSREGQYGNARSVDVQDPGQRGCESSARQRRRRPLRQWPRRAGAAARGLRDLRHGGQERQ
ncbi:MAG: hypothetical protein O7E54_09210 [Planctomycetota bacterium]|nr:hypothetical protein [Planctomycetota bacterium]